MIDRTIYTDENGIQHVSEIDVDTGIEVITSDGVEVSADPAEANRLAEVQERAREQRQLDRLDGKFDEVKANTTLQDSTRLTVADYRQNTGPADLRAMATQVNDLRALVIDQRSMILDLTRLVRGMAAE